MSSNPDKPQKILLLWRSYVKQDHLMEVVENLKKNAGDNGLVAVENLERLVVCKLSLMFWFVRDLILVCFLHSYLIFLLS